MRGVSGGCAERRAPRTMLDVYVNQINRGSVILLHSKARMLIAVNIRVTNEAFP